MPSVIPQGGLVLVTGATGFIGAWIVDVLLARGYRVRGTTRSLHKGQLMVQKRPDYADKLDFVKIEDFGKGEDSAMFAEAVSGVDGIIHVASPLSYTIESNERDLVVPAINGVKSLLTAAAKEPRIKRIVLTSSFASVLDTSRKSTVPHGFTYTGSDWNPLTYAEAIDPSTSPVVAYRGSKKFAERAAWDFIEARKGQPTFELTTFCPPMTFGPIRHPIESTTALNESNAELFKISQGNSLPVARVPFWIDVRDLAAAHVAALLEPIAGGKRYTVAAPERFSYALAAKIMDKHFDWAKGTVKLEHQEVDESYDLDGETVAKELGVSYRSFEECVVDLLKQLRALDKDS